MVTPPPKFCDKTETEAPKFKPMTNNILKERLLIIYYEKLVVLQAQSRGIFKILGIKLNVIFIQKVICNNL